MFTPPSISRPKWEMTAVPSLCVLACHAAGSFPQQPLTICMIGRCKHKNCRSLQGSWLACRHQHIGEMRKSESAAAHSRLEGPVPGCLHPSSSSHSVRCRPAACLFLSRQRWVNHREVIGLGGKKKERQLNQWLIVAQLYNYDSCIQLVFLLQLILVFSSYRSWIQLYIFSPLGLASCQENKHFLLSATLWSPKTNNCANVVGYCCHISRFLKDTICLFSLMKTVISICHWLVQHSMQNDIICELSRSVPRLHMAVECSCNRSVLLQKLRIKFSSVITSPPPATNGTMLAKSCH